MFRSSARLRVALVALAAGALLLGACGGGGGSSVTTARVGPSPTRGTPTLCQRLRARITGHVDDPAADELSGHARSLAQPGVLWTQEDSGADPVLLAMRANGHVLAHIPVTGAEAVDWEDIAAVLTPGDRSLLYVADIGDNNRARESIDVYRVPEPRLDAARSAPAARLRLRYPDGPHDAEALLVDASTDDLVVVTKTADGARAYRAPASLAPSATPTTLERGPRIDLGLVTAGDVSADHRIVAVRSYLSLMVWTRRPGEPLLETLARPGCRSPTLLLEGQGEALALDAHGTSALTVTEGSGAAVRAYSVR